METIRTLPPDILQSFSKDLLDLPAPKFYDDSETLYKLYLYAKKVLEKKKHSLHSPTRVICESYLTSFLEYYEWIKKKEKEPERKTGNKTQEPFYHLCSINGIYNRILQRSKHNCFKIPNSDGNNNEIQ